VRLNDFVKKSAANNNASLSNNNFLLSNTTARALVLLSACRGNLVHNHTVVVGIVTVTQQIHDFRIRGKVVVLLLLLKRSTPGNLSLLLRLRWRFRSCRRRRCRGCFGRNRVNVKNGNAHATHAECFQRTTDRFELTSQMEDALLCDRNVAQLFGTGNRGFDLLQCRIRKGIKRDLESGFVEPFT